MRSPITLIAILAALAVCALPAGVAVAGTSDRIYYDCEHSPTGALTGSYTKAQLQSALRTLPGDVNEYSGCYDAIKQALLDGGHATRAGSGPNGGGGGGGASNVTPGANTGGGGPAAPGAGGGSAPAKPHTGSKAPVTLAGATISPGVVPALGRDASALPTPLIGFLVLLGAGALGLVATTIGRRVFARRRA